MRRLFLFSFAAFLLWPWTPLPVARTETQAGFVLIGNTANSATKISSDELADYYLKKKRQWGDGTAIRFIDHEDDSTIRKLFLEKVIKKTAREVDLFWIGQKLYSGDRAPMQVASDATVASLVSHFKGAIGYVSPTFVLPSSIKKIEIMGISSF